MAEPGARGASLTRVCRAGGKSPLVVGSVIGQRCPGRDPGSPAVVPRALRAAARRQHGGADTTRAPRALHATCLDGTRGVRSAPVPVALVTGTSSGFGRGTAERLVALGWTVAATVRDPAQTAVPQGCDAVALDLRDPGSIVAAAADVQERYARLDALVSNAGIATSARRGAVAGRAARPARDEPFGTLDLCRACCRWASQRRWQVGGERPDGLTRPARQLRVGVRIRAPAAPGGRLAPGRAGADRRPARARGDRREVGIRPDARPRRPVRAVWQQVRSSRPHARARIRRGPRMPRDETAPSHLRRRGQEHGN